MSTQEPRAQELAQLYRKIAEELETEKPAQVERVDYYERVWGPIMTGESQGDVFNPEYPQPNLPCTLEVSVNGESTAKVFVLVEGHYNHSWEVYMEATEIEPGKKWLFQWCKKNTVIRSMRITVLDAGYAWGHYAWWR